MARKLLWETNHDFPEVGESRAPWLAAVDEELAARVESGELVIGEPAGVDTLLPADDTLVWFNGNGTTSPFPHIRVTQDWAYCHGDVGLYRVEEDE